MENYCITLKIIHNLLCYLKDRVDRPTYHWEELFKALGSTLKFIVGSCDKENYMVENVVDMVFTIYNFLM